MPDLPSIAAEFDCRENCEICDGSGHVCEDHPGLPAHGEGPRGCDCGGLGMPCPGGYP